MRKCLPCLLLLLLGCNETISSHYATVEEARADGAFQRGWVPAVLESGASDIRETHDLDTNRVRGTFAFNDETVKRFERDCTAQPSDPAPFQRFTCAAFEIDVDLNTRGTFRLN